MFSGGVLGQAVRAGRGGGVTKSHVQWERPAWAFLGAESHSGDSPRPQGNRSPVLATLDLGQTQRPPVSTPTSPVAPHPPGTPPDLPFSLGLVSLRRPLCLPRELSGKAPATSLFFSFSVPTYGKHCSHLLVGSRYFPGSHRASRAFALEGSRHGCLGSWSQQQTCPLPAASLTVRGPEVNSEFGVWEKQRSGVTPFVTLTTAPLYRPCDPVPPGG